jgi:hypothetical protein
MTWALVNGGSVQRIISTPTAITVSGISHPKSIFTRWTAEELKEIGILPYEETTVDNRYYWSGDVTYSVGSDKVVGSYEGTAKDTDNLKTTMKETVRSIAASLLSQTDWMVVRAAEGGTAVPEAVSTYRAAVRTESNEKETAIDALSNIAAIITWENAPYDEERKVGVYDEDGNRTGWESENDVSRISINKTTRFFAVDPLAEVDEAFVSLTAV